MRQWVAWNDRPAVSESFAPYGMFLMLCGEVAVAVQTLQVRKKVVCSPSAKQGGGPFCFGFLTFGTRTGRSLWPGAHGKRTK